MRLWRWFEDFTIKLIAMILAGLVLTIVAMIFLIIGVLLMVPVWGVVSLVVLLMRFLS
jgi:hypothetical protein